MNRSDFLDEKCIRFCCPIASHLEQVSGSVSSFVFVMCGRAWFCDAFPSGRRSPSLRWRLSLPSLSQPCRLAARWRRGIFAPRCSYGAEDWAHGVFPHRVDELPFAEVHHLHAAGVTLRFDRHERALAFQDFGAEYALVVAHAAGGEGLSGFDCRCHVVFFHAFNLCEAASHCNNYFQKSFAGGFRRESQTIGCSEPAFAPLVKSCVSLGGSLIRSVKPSWTFAG